MSRLSIFSNENSKNAQLESQLALEISELLVDCGIIYQQINWPRYNESLLYNLDEQQQLKQDVMPIEKYHQFPFSQLLVINDQYPNIERLRMKYLSEYSIDSDEIYYLLEGELLVSVHYQQQVLQLLCQAGSLLFIPAQMKRWLDIGKSDQKLVMMRFSEQQQEPVLSYTGSNLADHFAHLS